MNLNFEKDTLDLLKSFKDKNLVYLDQLKALKGLKVAIDGTLLLKMASSHANPHKFILEGGGALDIGL